MYFCSDFGVRKDSIGNRVRIPDSSRCCKLSQRLQQSLFILNEWEDANVRSKSEDLP